MATITRQVIGEPVSTRPNGNGYLVTVQGIGDWSDWSETFPAYKGTLTPETGVWVWSIGARGQIVGCEPVR